MTSNTTAKADAWLTHDSVLRLSVSLIKHYQDGQIRLGRLPPDALITTVLAKQGEGDALQLGITEDHLGIDSLGLLDLVMEVNRYFGLAETGVEDYLLVRKTLGDWVELIMHHLDLVGSTARLTFATSGSSGSPKLLTHTRQTLDAEITAIGLALFSDAAPDAQFISAVPPHHIYGFLWSVLLPHHLGLDCIDVHTQAPSAVIRNARAGDIIIATPFMWEKYAEYGLRFPSGVTGISSGGPTREATWGAIETVGIDRLIEVYGATETGGIGWRDNAESPFQLLPHLEVNNAMVLRRADAVACPLQDHLGWAGPDRFFLEGRQDRVVQVGGTNVSLDLIEDTLCRHAEVAKSAVRLEGQRLKAFVVPTSNPRPNLEADLRDMMATLSAVARPQRYTFGAALPRSETGKLQDW